MVKDELDSTAKLLTIFTVRIKGGPLGFVKYYPFYVQNVINLLYFLNSGLA